jgi:hypothetical protein
MGLFPRETWYLYIVGFVYEEEWKTSFTIDDATSGVPKRCHDVTFPLLTSHRGKYRIHLQDLRYPKQNIVYTSVPHTKNR